MRVSGYLYILEQFVCAAGLLCALARAAGIPRTSPLRLIVTALLCAGAATVSALRPLYLLRLCLLALVMLSPLAVWPGLPRRLRWTLPPLTLVLTLLASGAIRFLQSLALPGYLCVLIVFWLLPLLSRSPARQVPACAAVEIRCGAARVRLTALIDTGNLLRDPLTALPVVVISRRAAQRLIPLPQPGQLNPGLRQITVRTVAGLTPMTVFRPVSLHLMHSGAWQEVQAMVGIAPDGYDGVQALLPAALLQSSTQTFDEGG